MLSDLAILSVSVFEKYSVLPKKQQHLSVHEQNFNNK